MTGCPATAPTRNLRFYRNQFCFYQASPLQRELNEVALETYIRQKVMSETEADICFVWQDNALTLASAQRVIDLQRQIAPEKTILNRWQTHNSDVSDEWCRFFQENSWQVALSIDDLSVAQRITQQLNHWKIAFNLLVVINRQNSQQPQAFYRQLRELGTAFIQFRPLIERDAKGELSSNSVAAQSWGRFLMEVFTLWAHEDIGRVYIQLFESTLGVWCGSPSEVCALCESCDAISGHHRKSDLVDECLQCRAMRLCYGDCPEHRLEGGKSALCAGYRHFFTDTAPHMKIMRDLLKHHRSPVELMVMLQRS